MAKHQDRLVVLTGIDVEGMLPIEMMGPSDFGLEPSIRDFLEFRKSIAEGSEKSTLEAMLKDIHLVVELVKESISSYEIARYEAKWRFPQNPEEQAEYDQLMKDKKRWDSMSEEELIKEFQPKIKECQDNA